MNLRIIFSILISLFICGCAMTGRPNLPVDISSNDLNRDGYALIVGSLSRRNAAAIYDRWGINIRKVDSENFFEFNIEGKASTTAPFIAYDFDYRESKYSGNIFAYLVPAGTYEIYNYTLFQTRGEFYRHWSPEDNLSITFSVKENSINYIGEFAATENYDWKIFENKNRDIPMLMKKYPNLDWSDVVTRIPDKRNF
ncbi:MULTISPECIES: hypothetical protein [unclassified Shewanella]|uniref:hypothetical protein n=1 Tax=unclassified Shewanella TaxID=196818 RepID=UPI000B348461|nr:MULTISPECIES: hypothetical protein [unclassified Shewanella]MDH1471014.1 hypothetical protein [Shewanella sp. GD03713]QXN26340.1 hypothetical protein KVP08_007125 [Shewanella putrefaciens]VEE60626.1 Uncharacterised protein [Shewanella putrefaciens]